MNNMVIQSSLESSSLNDWKFFALASFHLEVQLFPTSSAKYDDVRFKVGALLCSKASCHLNVDDPLAVELPLEPFFTVNIKQILLYYEPKTELNQVKSTINFEFTPDVLPRIYVHQLNEDEAEEEIEGNDTSACHQWILPNKQFDGIWDTLIYDHDIKTNLLDYVSTTLMFSDRKVDSNIIAWNRVVLLHGPPGTGKTSLCKALAQKLAIRMSERYNHGQLVEINSHSLFSKWFSESGKLVMKMFAKIKELVDEQDSFVCVLIDEVESLTAARKAALSGTEPSDAIRVVNALLTQIDQLRNKDNVIILTTSNITGAIDLAFVDRADIKQYIGLPTVTARYHILNSCITELMRVGIISPRENLLDWKSLELLNLVENEATRKSLLLYEISKKCDGLSGRALRKLPFLAHAFFLHSTSNIEQFLYALSKTVDKELHGREQIASK